ncbi:hypothetical protein FM076_22815 [Streptomyces albus subsp. chlorinus]|nr:hypothetical protein [Streptomyces albus subsp. chlorinus]
MGLLSGVLLLPLAPVRGVEWVAGRLLETAEKELTDPATLRARLGALNRAFEDGEITEEEFEREEERLLDLLERRAPTAVTRTRVCTTDDDTAPQDARTSTEPGAETSPEPETRPRAEPGETTSGTEPDRAPRNQS